MTTLAERLNRNYARLHTAKEDAFWVQKMGLSDDPGAAQRELDEREIELARFLQDPSRVTETRAELEALRARLERASPAQRVAFEDERVALEGWLATFEAHAIESSEARALGEEIVAAEGRLASARAALELSYVDASGVRRAASSVKLSALLRGEADERVRRSAWEGLCAIEHGVLAGPFLEVVRLRNRLGRMLGGEDYYDWKTRRVERLSKQDVFLLLDELEARTRDAARASLDQLATRAGASALAPWNVLFATAGDAARELDPYFPFANALERWGRTFSDLGIRYCGAELVLDLVDRRGKYENGFMHGPEVAWRDHGRFVPARIHFTANALPGVVGAGQRATETLFHEGGHAAHFANVDMPAPCFGQEFAPTSVGFSETQSMFLDGLLEDAPWRAAHARDRAGRPMPWAVHERAVRATQPFAAWQARAMLAVCAAERALYEIPDRELDGERVLKEMRAAERRLLFLEGGAPRPSLAVPHLLSGESSAYYHGYVLAEMAVEITRRHFLARDGAITGNPRVGPELAERYWRPGNRFSFLEFVPRLTGRELSARELAERLVEPTDSRLDADRQAFERTGSRPSGPSGAPDASGVGLGARLRIVHGRATIAEGEIPPESTAGATVFEHLCARFARFVDDLEAAG